MYRNTYAEINLTNIKENVSKLINIFSSYKYHIAVVKADCYGHDTNTVVKSIIDGGANFLAVATLEEALEVRRDFKDIPVLCLGIISSDNLHVCKDNNITVTIPNLEYLKKINLQNIMELKVHLKINTGMNRLGISSLEEMNEVYKILNCNSTIIEGIYTHIYNDQSVEDTSKQIMQFENITNDINLNNIKIIHFGASNYVLKYPKKDYINGCRFGIAMYGLANYLDLKSTISLHSTVIQINEVENETVGYNGAYYASDKEKIAVVPIGYADGMIRKNTGRSVFINDKAYTIVGNICMDMLFVKVDNSVKLGDKVTLIKDNEHLNEIAKHLDTINYEIICTIGKRVPRVYKV